MYAREYRSRFAAFLERRSQKKDRNSLRRKMPVNHTKGDDGKFVIDNANYGKMGVKILHLVRNGKPVIERNSVRIE
jgi:hypothetical protein